MKKAPPFSCLRAGFFVTEFLIYLALSACIGLFIMRYIYGSSVRLRATTQQTDRIASIYAALDALIYDLEKAPCNVTDWRMLNEHELSWQQGDAVIGWQLDNGALMRRAKKYSNKEQRWKRSVSHVALEDVQTIQFTPHYTRENQLSPLITSDPEFLIKNDGLYRGKGDLHAITVAVTGRLADGKTYQCKRTVGLVMEVIV